MASPLLDIANLDLASTPNTLPPDSSSTSASFPSSSSPSIIPTYQTKISIHDIPTEIVIQVFTDRIFVIVTQLNRIGSLIQILPPPQGLPTSISSQDDLPSPSIVSTPVLGTAPSKHYESLYQLYSNQIGSISFDLQARSSANDYIRPVLLGIALKRPSVDGEDENEELGVSEEERKIFKAVMEEIKKGIAQVL